MIVMLQEQRAIAVKECDGERKAKRVKKLYDALDRAFDKYSGVTILPPDNSRYHLLRGEIRIHRTLSTSEIL